MKKKTKFKVAATSIILAILTISGFNCRKALNGYKLPELSTILGLDVSYEKPKQPEETFSTDESVEEILQKIKPTYDFSLDNMQVPNTFNSSCTKLEIDKTPEAIFDKTKQLMAKIKVNTNGFLSKNSKYETIFLEDNTSKSQNRDQSTVSSTLEDIIKQTITWGTNKDICIIGNLKVVLDYGNS